MSRSRNDAAKFLPLVIGLFRRSPLLGGLAAVLLVGVFVYQSVSGGGPVAGPAAVENGVETSPRREPWRDGGRESAAAETPEAPEGLRPPLAGVEVVEAEMSDGETPPLARRAGAEMLLGRGETLLTLKSDRGLTTRLVADRTRVVLRADGGGITLAGQLSPDEVVRLTTGRATIRGRAPPKEAVALVAVPDRAVRAEAVATDGERMLFRTSDGRVFGTPFERGLPTAGGGTLAAERVRVGTLLAERAGGDLVGDGLIPRLWEPAPVVPDARVVNFDRVVYTGPIDLSETFARIALKRRFPHNNDGSVFQNRERRLPRAKRGHYREYVHPTDGIRGPGPQRLVVGSGGRVWYTGDHYDSFREVGRR